MISAFLLISIMQLTFGYSFCVVRAVVTQGDAPVISRFVLSTNSSLLLCCTVRNQAEMFRDKTGVVLSGRLSRPLGFVVCTSGCAHVWSLNVSISYAN